MTLPRDELERVAGALYAALELARPIVDREEQEAGDAGLVLDAALAATALEAIDGALADAGELVGLGGRLRGGERGRTS